MAITLFKHQVKAVNQIIRSWANGNINVLSVLPTGAGKTILLAEMARRELESNPVGVVIIFAHRDILVEQISEAMCVFGMKHSFITSVKTRKNITDMHMEKFGRSYDEDGSRLIIASVDKFRQTDTTHINSMVTKWFLDEAHHLLVDGKWDACINRFPNATGLGVTATPIRADKRGLGRDAQGMFDDICIGATMHELILAGKLAPYKIYTPPVLIDMSGINVTATGDYNNIKLSKATDRTEVTGDVIKNYKRIAFGKQGICFAVNIAHSDHLAKAFNAAGISAVSLSSKSDAGYRRRKIQEFKAGKIMMLCNCDLFSEGFDVPNVSVVIQVRKTESYALWKQQFGRCLRILEGKTHGILIDHVGNVEFMMDKYKLAYPHDDPTWTLSDYKKFQVNDDGKGSESVICGECYNRYVPRGTTRLCPECDHLETVEEQLDSLKKLQAKEADLVPMTIDFIDQLLLERAKADRTAEEYHKGVANMYNQLAKRAAISNHGKRLIAQQEFRALYDNYCLKLWMTGKHDVETTQRQFEVDYGVNMLSAQCLGAADTLRLIVKMKGATV